MKIEELKVYNLSLEFGEDVWKLTEIWDSFSKEAIGKMLILSADQIAAHISTGFGRFNPRETLQYAYYSRGALYETKTWLTKAFNRNLIREEDFQLFMNNIDGLGKMLNNYIRSISKPKEKEFDKLESV
ncbi:MAG: hypothetical protein A2W91_18955 [Bacteroidetes bacterium GWF2_38_335]|nr:MAG: hypothetical protein A2W91_18955 [Bacteroidetes bacterium GWF2_38_335]OFY80246.1 MAG: hypothetical protein A2281_17240 [Bacteroidetes bacterium RIFOXYA12_FULL_38_20]HBS88723.1 four helix bundle protein [Bacteroidales bacterium]